MKNAIFLIYCTLLAAIAQAQTFNWVRTFGGWSSENAVATALDAEGNIYTVGTFTGAVDFDPSYTSAMHFSKGENDIFIQKLGTKSNFIWALSYGSPYEDAVTSIAVDKKGDVIVVGRFIGTIDLDPGPLKNNLTSLGAYDNFILKFNSSGVLLWGKSYGSAYSDYVYDVAVDDSGNIYSTGYFEVGADYDPGVGVATITSKGSNDVFVQKLNADGEFIWVKTFGGKGDDIGTSIALDAYGNVYTTGGFYDTVDFDPGPSNVSRTATGATSNDAFIHKMDRNGKLIWVKTFGGVLSELPVSMTIDRFGSLYSVGRYDGVVDFDPGVGIDKYLTNHGSYLHKMDTLGNYYWAGYMEGTINAIAHNVATDKLGSVYIVGTFNAAHIVLGSVHMSLITGVNSNDAFILKADAQGNLIWAKTFGGKYHDACHSIAIDTLGSIYTVGYFQDTVDFDPSSKVVKLGSNGGTDVFVLKYVQKLTSQENLLYDGLITIAPNPTKGTANILFDQLQQEVTLTLTDIQGRLQYHQTYHQLKQTQLELKGPPGVYLLTIKTSQGQTIFKMIKE